MHCILALDQSTSATKAMLFASDGRLLDKESRDHVQHYPQPGWVEHDAEEIWQHVLIATRLAPFPECSAWGAAMMGLLGLGAHGTLAGLAALAGAGRVYRPQMPPDHAAELVRRWRHAVQQTILRESG